MQSSENQSQREAFDSNSKKEKNPKQKILISALVLLVIFAGWLFYREMQKQVTVDVWGTSGSASTQSLEDNLSLLKEKFGSRLTINLHLTANLNGEETVSLLTGSVEDSVARLDLTENERQLLIAKYEKDKFWEYLKFRNANINDLAWERYAEIAGVNTNKIKELLDEGKGKELLKESADDYKTLNEEQVETLAVPAVFINDELYVGSYDLLSLSAAVVKPVLRIGKDKLTVHPRWGLFDDALSIGLPSRTQYKGINECYIDLDCNDNADKNGACTDANTESAHCEYTEPNFVELTILTDDECLSCNESDVFDVLKLSFKGLTTKTVDIDTEEGSNLADTYGITLLPSYIFSKDIEQTVAYESFSQAQYISQLTDGSYLLTQSTPYISLERTYTDNTLDLFVMSTCRYSIAATNAITKLEEEKLAKGETFPKLTLNYVLPFELDENNEPQIKMESLGGDYDLNEDKRQLVIQKYFPDRFYEYLRSRAENITDEEGWKEVAENMGLDTKIIETRVASEGEALLLASAEKGASIGLQNVPAYLRNNVEIVNSIPDLKEIPGLEELSINDAEIGLCSQVAQTQSN
ncbi:MAG: hypothetical protein ABIE68_00985 [bacterium]